MAGRILTFLKNAWAQEPVLVVSFSVWGLGFLWVVLAVLDFFVDQAVFKLTEILLPLSAGIIAITMPMISPYTKYAGMINRAIPYNYPVPVRDDGNKPDVPSHPQEPQGPSLEWLKNL